MKITAVLLRDHQTFYGQFDALESGLLKPAGSEIRSQVAELSGSLGTHARLEDELLFTTLEPFIGGMGPLGVMRIEHEEIERTLTQLQEPADSAATEDLVRQLVDVARQHFAKEETILFPMAEQVLSLAELEELGAQFDARRRVVMI